MSNIDSNWGTINIGKYCDVDVVKYIYVICFILSTHIVNCVFPNVFHKYISSKIIFQLDLGVL